jgi:hypothetical protein
MLDLMKTVRPKKALNINHPIKNKITNKIAAIYDESISNFIRSKTPRAILMVTTRIKVLAS